MNDHPSTMPTGEALSGRRRIRPRIAGAVATMAMGSWIILAVIPMVVAIVALT